MNNEYLARAREVMPDAKELIVVASRRARSLALGARPMVRCNEQNFIDVALLEIAEAAESIANAAKDLADLVITGFKPHPVFKMVMEESDKSIIRLTISEDSDLANNTLGDLLLVNRTGMRVIAIRRGVSWIYGPDKYTTLLANDTLILKGTEAGADLFEKLATGACSLEDIPEELEDED